MYRFFGGERQENHIFLNKEDSHHLMQVLRHNPGDLVETIWNGELFLCRIEGEDPRGFRLQILEEKEIEQDGGTLILCQGICKGSKMDTVVQKAVELGANRIIPFFSIRSVVRPTDKDDKKTCRLREIARAAAMQSKSPRIPEVEDFQDLKQLTGKISGQILIAYENQAQESLCEVFQTLDKNKPVYLFIGPEGGFEEEEVEALLQKGGKSIRLGQRILRTETAGMVLLTLLQYSFGGME